MKFKTYDDATYFVPVPEVPNVSSANYRIYVACLTSYKNGVLRMIL